MDPDMLQAIVVGPDSHDPVALHLDQSKSGWCRQPTQKYSIGPEHGKLPLLDTGPDRLFDPDAAIRSGEEALDP